MTDKTIPINSDTKTPSEFPNIIEIKNCTEVEKAEFASQVYLIFSLSQGLIGLGECFVISMNSVSKFMNSLS